MLNADDPETVISLRRLRAVAAEGTRPLVFWIGAGSSRWLGYPSWEELTRGLRKDFSGNVAGFDNQQALVLISQQKFPTIFQMCRDLDEPRYHRLIASAFLPRTAPEAYRKFIESLAGIEPLFAVTTNVDEALESHRPASVTVQRSDLSRCIELLQKKTPFVAKLHGSTSSVKTTIFTISDYQALVADPNYIQTLKYIFASCTVIFLGYGVRDSYVIRLLSEDASERDLFGPGPHFVVTNEAVGVKSLHRIRYETRLRPDHTAALSVLAYIRQSRPEQVTAAIVEEHPVNDSAVAVLGVVPPGKTAYYISDLMPPGTWQTSQEITAKGGAGEIEVSFGLGFTNDEIPFRQSTALHDLAVGLICFDFVYLPFSALALAHDLVGADLFWELVHSGSLIFVHNEAQLGVLFVKGEIIGDLGNIIGGSPEGPTPVPVPQLIRRALKAAPGKDAQAESLFDELERWTTVYKRAVEINLPSLVRSALLMPAISKLLGIGDAILPTQAPRWLRFPYLRLAHLVQTGALCNEYGIQAAKVPFGGIQLTSAAFGVLPKEWQADHLASYVAAGNFNSDLGALLLQDMSITRKILKFRESNHGESFRREVGHVLAAENGQFNASVNAGLKQTIPPEVLQRAHDQLLRLMTENRRITVVPAVWGDARQSDATTRYLRAKSQKLLLELCEARAIGKNDPCICGSGEKLRLCCLPPLR